MMTSKSEYLRPETRVLPGHGDETTVGAEAARIDEYVARAYLVDAASEG